MLFLEAEASVLFATTLGLWQGRKSPEPEKSMYYYYFVKFCSVLAEI